MEDDKAPVYSKSQILVEKMMITVIWGVFGTYILDELPEGEHFNSAYFVDHILMPLDEKKNVIWPGGRKRKI